MDAPTQKEVSLTKIGEIINALNCTLREWGWVLAVYGSSLKGYSGGDIDLIAFNRTDNTTIDHLDAFFHDHNFKLVHQADHKTSFGRIYEYHNYGQFIRFDVHVRFTKGENWPD